MACSCMTMYHAQHHVIGDHNNKEDENDESLIEPEAEKTLEKHPLQLSRRIYICCNVMFFILGIATSISWRTISFAMGMWTKRYEFKLFWPLLLTSYNSPGIFIQLLQLKYDPYFDVKYGVLRMHIIKGSVAGALLFFSISIVPFLWTYPLSDHPTTSMLFMFAISFIIGCTQSALFGWSIKLASIISCPQVKGFSFILAGGGGATFLVLFATLLSHFSFLHNDISLISCLEYFEFAAFFVAIASVSWFYFSSEPTISKIIKSRNYAKLEVPDRVAVSCGVAHNNFDNAKYDFGEDVTEGPHEPVPMVTGEESSRSSCCGMETCKCEVDKCTCQATGSQGEDPGEENLSAEAVSFTWISQQIKLHLATTFLCSFYLVLLTGALAFVQASSPIRNDTLLKTILMYVMALFMFLGNELSAFLEFGGAMKYLFATALSFFGFLVFIIIYPSVSILQNDLVLIGVVAFSSALSTYLNSNSYSKCKAELEKRYREKGSSAMNIALYAGTYAGLISSFILPWVMLPKS